MPACRRDGARETQAARGQDPPGERGPTRPGGWEMLPVSTVARPREPSQPRWGWETQVAPSQDPPGERGPTWGTRPQTRAGGWEMPPVFMVAQPREPWLAAH